MGLLLYFVWIERRRSKQAMTVELFASKIFLGLSFTFLLYGALGALFVLIPLY